MPATEEHETAYKNLDTLPYPHFDGSGCRVIDLGSDVYGLVDWDAGVYRVGLYWNLPDDDGGVCAEFKSFEDMRAFTTRLSAAHAPTPVEPHVNRIAGID